MQLKRSKRANLGFTIVELIVVITVVGLLAGLSVIGYSSWRSATQTAQIKSDLNSVAAAMESSRNYNNSYPSSIPSSALPSSGSIIVIDPASTSTNYCVDGTIPANSSITFYIASESKDKGPQQGTCASR